MRNLNKIVTEELEDLFIKIYLIGFEMQGESCIFLIYSEKPKRKLIYSIVMDCYKDSEINEIEEVCKDELGQEKLDMLVWSHPHDDHTIGLNEIIEKYCDEQTKIILANILDNNRIVMSDTCKELAEYISKLNFGKKKKKYNINSMVNYNQTIQKVNFSKSSNVIKGIEIRCIAPMADVIAKQPSLREENINLFSVGLLIVIDIDDKKMNFLLTGDMVNEVFNEIAEEQEDDEIPNTYNYVKIPHHGGKSAQNLVKILNRDTKCPVAGTTIFRISKDDNEELKNPFDDTIRAYKKYIEKISCTSDVKNVSYGKGVIVTEFDVSSGKFSLDVRGKAIEEM